MKPKLICLGEAHCNVTEVNSSTSSLGEILWTATTNSLDFPFPFWNSLFKSLRNQGAWENSFKRSRKGFSLCISCQTASLLSDLFALLLICNTAYLHYCQTVCLLWKSGFWVQHLMTWSQQNRLVPWSRAFLCINSSGCCICTSQTCAAAS